VRLLQVMAGAQHGGAEAFFERLVGALHTTDIEQKVVVRKDADRQGRLAGYGISASTLPFGGMLDLYTPLALRCIAKHFEPDIVLTWMNRATRMMPRGKYIQVARLGGFYDLKYYKGCDHLIGNTRGIVDYLIDQGWPVDRTHYLPNFVTVDVAEPVTREKFDTPADVPLLLSMGRLHTNKAFDVLIEAMAHVEGAYLWIAGEGSERLALETLAFNRGVDQRIRFLGWRDDIGALLAASDIYVCPSRHEPLGNVVIEGWAAGKPVVAAASQGPTELISHNENGLLVPVDDAPALASELNRVIADTDLQVQLSTGGNATYEAEFTQDVVVAEYLGFFDQIRGVR
jgi:glycosyltransferase involved in cell wall biosynthesis